MREKVVTFCAIIGGGLVLVAAIGKFSPKTSLTSAGIGIFILLVLHLSTRDNSKTP